jgi:hypothetical protein
MRMAGLIKGPPGWQIGPAMPQPQQYRDARCGDRVSLAGLA